MSKQYIDIPLYTTFNDISSKNFSLSATQYKSFCIKNQNVLTVRDFLSRDLERKDLGSEVGSEAYVDESNYFFVKTKALQAETYLLDINKESLQNITPMSFINSDLKKGDLLISKDSNVGEIAILDKDYPNTMLCGGIYKLPISDKKYYLLAFIKNDIFRQQIDFLVPRGSTIRHGKTKFLECQIPMPNKNASNTIKYVELLMQAILNKEIEIKNKHTLILQTISDELSTNQKDNQFKFQMPTLSEILSVDRLDSNRYCEEYKKFRFLVSNYKNGYSCLEDYGYKAKRGQNLQVSAIGKSVYSDVYYEGFYDLILSQNLSKEGRVLKKKYLGNENKLSVLQQGDIVFSARGQCLGRSFVVLEQQDRQITNIDSMVFYGSPDIRKSCFIHLMLDLYRSNDFIKKIGINGSGAESVTKYQLQDIPFPNFPAKKEEAIVRLYHNPKVSYDASESSLENFLEYDTDFNANAGIYELDKSMKYLQSKLEQAIVCIANDEDVDISF